MKLGFYNYPSPEGVEPGNRLEWTIEKAAELELRIIGGHPPTGDVGTLRKIRDHADARDVEIEPYIQGVFGLVGPTAKESFDQLRLSIASAKVLARSPYVHTGYGRLNLETSRFNKAIPIREHLGILVANLKEAAKVAADEGVVIAVENHCDFIGHELAEVIAEVGSPNIQVCLDTGNSLTVLNDPTADLEALAPYIVTTHLKDLKVVQANEPGRVPFTAEGCPLGDGEVNVALTLRTLAERGPRGMDTPLVLEQGWLPVPPGAHRAEVIARAFHDSIAYLRQHFPAYLS
jgi:sugar phosphate isomerase/epimerase